MAAAIVTIAAIAGTLMMPAAAEASLYIWNVDANGSWTTPGNWLHAGGGPVGAGYPNAPGDQAFFTGSYTAARTITIPSNVFITVGAIYFGSPVSITVTGSSTSRLVLDNGATAAQVVSTVGNKLIFRLDAVMLLRSSLLTTLAENSFLHLGPLIEDGGVRSLTKRGSGGVSLDQPNAYTGVTKVEQGVLAAVGAGGGALLGNVEVGTGVGAASARVLIGEANQLHSTSILDVKAGGILQVDDGQTARHLRIQDGRVHLASDANFVIQELTMTGGIFETQATFELPGNITMTSSAQGPAVFRPYLDSPRAVLLPQTRTIRVDDGPGPVDVEIAIGVTGFGALIKEGAGTLRFTGPAANSYLGPLDVRQGVLELARDNGVAATIANLRVGFGTSPAKVVAVRDDNIAGSAIDVGPFGAFDIRDRQEEVGRLSVARGGFVSIGGSARLSAAKLEMAGGRISLLDQASRLMVSGAEINAASSASDSAVIDGAGTLTLSRFAPFDTEFVIDNGPEPVDLRVAVNIEGLRPDNGLRKIGSGTAVIEKTAAVGITVEEGPLLVTGVVNRAMTMSGGTLAGTGTLASVTASGGRLAPGLSPGLLLGGAITLNGTSTFDIELNGTSAGAEYDQLDVRGAVNIGGATLALSVGFTPPPGTNFTIIANDAIDPVIGTFAGLAEGATVTAGAQTFAITYHGGDGNDVVLTAKTESTPMTYYLAEGATGAFFDDDVLIANPNDRDAPITLTFLKEGGATVVEQRVVPAMSRLTVQVEQIAGLESTAASVEVRSNERLPLIVERTMFWDASYYGGHTANAVARPEARWIFAEGFQGFFDTYILIANADAEPATATLTFLREGDTPFVASVPVGPFARQTVYAGDYPELAGRAFGIVVEATRPVIAERAMYFASQPGRLWTGGHVNTGLVTPSRSWFHAEGATGGFFNTFILLSNPQDTAAQVELRFLLDTGHAITRPKTLEPRQRLTVNPAAEGDVRLENAAVSTVVDANVPIVSERSMYWPEGTTPFGEGHNSTGVASLATKWGLAEGRIGGSHAFDTFILLANPSAQAAEVRITYLRENGAPIVRQHTVPATARFNVDVKTTVAELQDAAFGAVIEVTNAVPIAVERSLYWNANGIFWAGGTNALATPLP